MPISAASSTMTPPSAASRRDSEMAAADTPSAFHPKVALNRIAIPELPHHAVLWNVHHVFGRLRDVRGRSRYRAEHAVAERRGCAVRALVRRHARMQLIADRDAALTARQLVLHWSTVHREIFPDQAVQISQRAA